MDLILAVTRLYFGTAVSTANSTDSVLLTLFDIEFGSGLISSNLAPQWNPADVLFILSKITWPDINHILLLGGILTYDRLEQSVSTP